MRVAYLQRLAEGGQARRMDASDGRTAERAPPLAGAGARWSPRPHPLLGRLTIRAMRAFTVYQVAHAAGRGAGQALAPLPPTGAAGRYPVTSDRYQRIYAVVRRIPRGKVATYGQVAELAGMVNAARQVGYALHALSGGSTLPWHRVINRTGHISLSPEAGGLEQRFRLLEEGIMVDAAGRIALGRHQWRPRSRR